MKKLPKEKRKDGTLNIRINEKLFSQVKKRAKELDMNTTTYLTACLIYDLRYGDATEHVKQLIKNYSIGYLVTPDSTEEHEAQMKEYWRAKQKERYS